MIRLEHINLVVADLDKTLAFYQAAFPHWQVRDQGDGDWYGVPRRWLHFGDDYTYMAFNSPGVGANRDLASMNIGLMHFAFDISDHDALKARMVAAEYPVKNHGTHSTFRKNVYFLDPDGFEVEFVEYSSDNPALRNSDA